MWVRSIHSASGAWEVDMHLYYGNSQWRSLTFMIHGLPNASLIEYPSLQYSGICINIDDAVAPERILILGLNPNKLIILDSQLKF
mgnify:CR=1 FL=1